MEIILKGSEKNIKRFLESYKLWLKRNSIEVIKTQDAEAEGTPLVNKISDMKVSDVVQSINKAETLEELEPYLSDERKGVVKALEVKMTELEK